MFNSGLKEDQTGLVEILDFNSDPMKLLINYLYTGEFPDEKDLTLEFLTAADIFGEDELREACEAQIKSTIALDNIMAILTTSFTYNTPTLRKAALTFVCKNMNAVKGMPDWKNLEQEHPQVLREVMEMAFADFADL